MKRKIIGILVMMLLLASLFPTFVPVAKINNEQNNLEIEITSNFLDDGIFWCPEGQEKSWILTTKWTDDPERPICHWVDPEELPDFVTFDPNPSEGEGETSSTITASPGYCEEGEYQFTVYAAESCYGEPHWEFLKTMIVNNTNRPPSISVFPSVTDITVDAGDTIYFDVYGSDPDLDECGNDALTFECSHSDYFHPYEEEPNHYFFEWTPCMDDVGTQIVTFSLWDLWEAIRQHEIVVKIRAGEQPPWNHSTLCCKSGSIRDDELARLICDELWRNRNTTTNELNVKDVKIMCQQCFGGGMSDDIKKIFESGRCQGVPWVFGSASNWKEPSFGWTNGLDCWTDALHPKVTGNKKVIDSFKEAHDDDVLGDVQGGVDSGGKHLEETPTHVHGNGGDNVKWNTDPNTKHVAVLFGGKLDPRHRRDIDKIEEVLKNAWGNDANKYKFFKDKGTADEGKCSSLRNMIARACENLTNKTQLVLYFTDHGDTHHNESEFQEWKTKIIREAYESLFSLHTGWTEGFDGMVDMDIPPEPYLSLGLMEPIQGDDWMIILNDEIIQLPSGTLQGEVEIPVDFTIINSGLNSLQIINLGSGEMQLNGLELSSGPVPTITIGHPPHKPDKPTGETNGKTGQSYDYTTSVIDPNTDDVCYGWDWNGDNEVDEWTDYYPSSETITTPHTWDTKGTYNVKVKAKDTVGNEGEWSDPLSVKMPRNRAMQTPFLNFLEQYPILYQLLQRFLQL